MELEVGNTKIPYTVVRNEKAKRTRVELSSIGFDLVIPPHTSDLEIEEILERKKRWITEKWFEIQEIDWINPIPTEFVSGSNVYLFGRYFQVKVEKENQKDISFTLTNRLLISIPKDAEVFTFQSKIKEKYKQFIADHLDKQIDISIKKYSKFLCEKPLSYSIRDLADKWGHCTLSNKLVFNWQLVFAPKYTIQYVVLHEMVHTLIRNHSQDFWTKLRSKMPDFELRKQWLEQEGKRIDI